MGKKNKDKKEVVFLVCSETGDRNYTIRKKPRSAKIEVKKYSKHLKIYQIITIFPRQELLNP